MPQPSARGQAASRRRRSDLADPGSFAAGAALGAELSEETLVSSVQSGAERPHVVNEGVSAQPAAGQVVPRVIRVDHRLWLVFGNAWHSLLNHDTDFSETLGRLCGWLADVGWFCV